MSVEHAEPSADQRVAIQGGRSFGSFTLQRDGLIVRLASVEGLL